MFSTRTKPDRTEHQKHVDEARRLVSMGRGYYEVTGHKDGAHQVAYHAYKPGQNNSNAFRDTGEFLAKIGRPKFQYILAERFLIDEAFYKQHKPDEMDRVAKARNEIGGETSDFLNRYDAIRTDPKKIQHLAGWAQHQLRIKPVLDDRIYKINTYGGKETEFGNYYDTMTFAHFLSQEADLLSMTIEQKKSTNAKFQSVANNDMTSNRRDEPQPEPKPDHFWRNMMLLAIVASAADPNDPSVTTQQQQDIYDRWDHSSHNQDILQDYMPQQHSHGSNNDWQSNGNDTTTRNELDTLNVNVDTTDYQQPQQDDPSPQQPDQPVYDPN